MGFRRRLPGCSILALATLGACAAPSVTPAPASPPMANVADAAQGITVAAVQRHLDVLANDSLKGRDTDRPEIWTAARYIAREFERDGLRPLAGGFIQSYRLTHARLDTARVRLSVGGTRQLRWGQEFAMGGSEVAEVHGPLQYLGTVRWGTPFPTADVAGAIVLARVSREDFVQGLTLGALELEAERGAVAWGVVVDAPAPPGLLHRVAVQYAARVGSRPTLVSDPAGLAALLAGSRRCCSTAACMRTCTPRTTRRTG